MFQIRSIIYLAIISIGFFGANNASAAVTLPWSTTYNCADWTQSNGLYNINCDGLTGSGSNVASDSYGTYEEQITAVANYSGGVGGKGQRHWIGDGGASNNSGSLKIAFNNAQTELWVRFYMRFETGLQWNTLTEYKILYINTGYSNALIFAFDNADKIGVSKVGSGQGFSQTGGWNTVMANGGTDINGNKTSDGQWHAYEVHMKADTNGTDGISEVWVDGIKKASFTNLNLGGSTGWTTILIGSNARTPSNGRVMYVDYDDIAVSTTGYIGPITGGATDTTPPSAPSGLVVN